MTCPVRIIKQISQLQDSTCSLDTRSFLRKGSILYLPLKTSPLHPRKQPIKFSDAFVFSSTRIKKSVFQANQANYKLMNAYVCAKRKAKGMIFTIKQNENQKVWVLAVRSNWITLMYSQTRHACETLHTQHSHYTLFMY